MQFKEVIYLDLCFEHSAHSEHFDRLDARVGELEGDNKELSRFTERITVLVDKYDKQLDDHDKRLAAIEAKPSKRWESVTGYLITSSIMLVMGYLAGQVGIG